MNQDHSQGILQNLVWLNVALLHDVQSLILQVLYYLQTAEKHQRYFVDFYKYQDGLGQYW